MFKSGWVRLWVVASIVWLLASERQPRITFGEGMPVSPSKASQSQTIVRHRTKPSLKSIKNELTTKVFCGAALILPFVVLLLGIGIAWVRRGFASKT